MNDAAPAAAEAAFGAILARTGMETTAEERFGMMVYFRWGWDARAARPAPPAAPRAGDEDAVRAFVARIASTRCNHDDATCERWIHAARALLSGDVVMGHDAPAATPRAGVESAYGDHYPQHTDLCCNSECFTAGWAAREAARGEG